MSKLKIKPIGARILVQFSPDGEQLRGGIFIPDSAKEKPQQAKVIALGSGAKAKDGTTIGFEVKVGDNVLVGKYAGSEVKVEDQKFTLLREDEILGILT